MMLGQVLIVFLLAWILVLRWQRRKLIQLANKFGSPKQKPLPLIGHAYMFLGSDEVRMKAFQRLGRDAIANDGIVALWQGHRLYLVIADASIAEYVLKNCLEKDDTMKCLRMLTGNGSVFAPVNIWRPRRKVLAPNFSPKNLKHFVQIFSRQTTVMVDQLKAVVGKGDFSIWKYITTYSMDSVCESTLGINVNTQNENDHPFLKSFELITQLDSARLCQPWLHSEAIYKLTPAYQRHTRCRNVMYEFLNKIITAKRISMEKEKQSLTKSDQDLKRESLRTFLELLIETSGGDQGYSDVELREETLVLVLAGTDTSAVGSAFTSVLLSKYPDVQEKVYQELLQITGGTKRPIVADDLPKMKYLDAVLRETLRLYPSVPVIVRKAVNEITLPNGITLIKDTALAINIWAVHRNPQYWGSDAEQFRPERFIDSPLKNPAAFMAFSYGPRSCVGYRYAMMSMKTALAGLLLHYRIVPATIAGSQDEPLRVKFDVMMKHVDDFTVQLEPRT